MMIRLLLLAAFALTSFIPRSGSKAPFGALAGDARLLRHASLDLRSHSRSQVRSWLRKQPSVAWFSDRSGTIDVHFRDGTRGLVVPAWPARLRPPQGALLRHVEPLSRAHTPVGRALVLEPFATELGPGPAVQEPEVQELQAAGYQVDYLYDTAVTVSVMASLSKYNVVYMRQHSDPFAGGDGVLATGQLDDNDPSVAPLIQDGSVVPVTVSGSDAQYYAITSTFIRLHEGLFPTHSMVVLNGCGMLQAPIFWNVLAGKNVGVMVSWNGESNNFDTYLSGSAFMNEMKAGLSVTAAISAIQQVGYGTSTVAGQQSAMGYLGDGTITLSEAATGSPPAVATSAPSAPTATPVRPAATPGSTATGPPATSGPPLPLTVQVRPLVQPGRRQLVHIHSLAGAAIHIHVVFPNGDEQSSTTATDASGTARFVYIQHPDTIVFGHLMATVTVTAVKGAGTVTRSVQYRIGWAPIDVTAVPRVQAVGAPVHIWVHTQPRSLVRIVLRFPKRNQVVRFRVRTGARGWAHVHYRVGRYLKNGNNHTVQVRARTRVAGTAYAAKTTFTIT